MKKNIQILVLVYAIWSVVMNVALQFAYFIPLRTGYIHPFSPWANFDGVHYLSIAQNGYTNNMRFMPLYPILIRMMGGGFWGAVFLSHVFLFFALFFLYKLFCLDYSHKKSLALTVLTLLLPTSFFYAAIYTEGLFLLLTVLTFYSARKKEWVLAGVFGFLASLTRIVGFLIFIPIVYEYISHTKSKRIRDFANLLLIPLGTAVYAAYNLITWKNPLLFIHAHSQLANGRSSSAVVLFPQTMYRYFKMITTVSISLWEWKIAVLELTIFCAGAIGIYILWKQKVRISYIIYTALSLLVPASSGTFTGLPRYIIVVFPLLIVFSGIRNRKILISILISMFMLQIALLLFFSRGYYVA